MAGDTLLLGGDSLRAMKKIVKKYKWKQIDAFEYTDIDYSNLKWHPNFNLDDIDEKNDKFTVTIDIADGAGKDYSIINIFKVGSMSPVSINKLRRDRVEDETGMFRLTQVGLFRSNKVGVDELARIAEIIVFEILGEDATRIAMEMNFKGDLFIEKFSKNKNYYEEIFLYTYHNEKTKRLSLGIKIHQHNKIFFCREFRKLILEKRLVLNEEETFNELNNFGVNTRGSYSCQTGHDDIAMSSIFVVPMLSSASFAELVESIYEFCDIKTKDAIQHKLSETIHHSDEAPFMFLKDTMKKF